MFGQSDEQKSVLEIRAHQLAIEADRDPDFALERTECDLHLMQAPDGRISGDLTDPADPEHFAVDVDAEILPANARDLGPNDYGLRRLEDIHGGLPGIAPQAIREVSEQLR